MKPQIFYLALNLLPFLCLAQAFRDDFSDGNISTDPPWYGHVDRFTVQQGELRLSDPAAVSNNVSWLSAKAETSLHQETTWEFYARLQLAPSPSNFSRFYLASSVQDLSSPLQGYFIRLGGINGDGDAIELFRQTGTQLVLLASGQAGAVAQEPVVVRIRVVRSREGLWQLYADYTGGLDYVSAAPPVQDSVHPLGKYTGVYCRYTATRAQAFYYDDIYIDSLYVDLTAPVLQEIRVETAQRLVAVFSEPLDTFSTASNMAISLEPYPGSFSDTIIAGHELIIDLERPLISQQAYQLRVSGVTDLYGNESTEQTMSFTYLDVRMPLRGELVLTEFMADPDPVVRFLPNTEYVEIRNVSTHVLDLSTVAFSTGATPQRLPASHLLPGAYAIICRADQAAALGPYGQVLPLANFPAIVNNGDELILTNTMGDTLVSLAFDLSWYKHPQRQQGGWSLELMDQTKPWHCASNWMASQHENGGTPGRENSVHGMTMDTVGPIALHAFVQSDQLLRVFFNESLNHAQEYLSLIRFEDGTAITGIRPGDDLHTLDIETATPLLSGRTYTVIISALVEDCIGNMAGTAIALKTGKPEIPRRGQLIINEVLFNPHPGGSDFIELYNLSDQFFNAKELQLINLARATNHQAYVHQDYLIAPGAYVVLTNHAADILARYRTGGPGVILEQSIPSLDDNNGQLGLYFRGEELDQIEYQQAWHHPLLDNRNGVSLERLYADGNGMDRFNWHSAAGSVGYATPGLRNSQQLGEFTAAAGVTLAQYIFSPDQDGYEDKLVLQYHTDQPGFIMNVGIVDLHGRRIRKLVSNELIGQAGVVVWDGVDDRGQLCRTGIYLLDIELFEPGGRMIRSRKSCVLSGRAG